MRMFVQMAISLYTSRLVLELLGIEDYGIYSVVGGLVAMVSYINQALSSSTMRYISFSIGEDNKNIHKIFSTSISIHIFISLFVIILAETVGLWFLNSEMNIPDDRRLSAMWVFQLSVISTVFVILSLPYSALIIAAEKMSIYAYISIADAVFKLLTVSILFYLPYDKLLEYAVFMTTIQILYTLFYVFYCRGQFSFSRIRPCYDKLIGKSMLSFSAWSMFGCTASIANTQGVNMLLNIFGGPVLNAARGIAVQVQAIVNNFAVNFQTAVNPQIIKYYAKGAYDELQTLAVRSAKFSFFLLLIMILPISINVATVLKWWLGNFPNYTEIFIVLILMVTLIDSLSSPLMKTADATGRIKRYHMIVGGFLMLLLPTGYVLLKCGFPVYSVFVCQIAFSLLALFLRLYIIAKMVDFSIQNFLKNAVLPSIAIMIITFAMSFYIKYQTLDLNAFLSFLISSAFAEILSGILIWFIGLNNGERSFIISKIPFFRKSTQGI